MRSHLVSWVCSSMVQGVCRRSGREVKFFLSDRSRPDFSYPSTGTNERPNKSLKNKWHRPTSSYTPAPKAKTNAAVHPSPIRPTDRPTHPSNAKN